MAKYMVAMLIAFGAFEVGAASLPLGPGKVRGAKWVCQAKRHNKGAKFVFGEPSLAREKAMKNALAACGSSCSLGACFRRVGSN